MSATVIAWCALGAAALAAVWRMIDRWLWSVGLVRHNFRGDAIPVGYGLIVVLWASAAILYAASAVLGCGRAAGPYLLALGGFGLLGLIDDAWGDRSATGLKGHFRALLTEGRVTTGLVKAVGGLALAAVLAAWVGEGSLAREAIGALVIALAANAVNLLDLRPGRAGAAFLLAAAAVGLGAWLGATIADLWPLGLVAVPAAAVYVADRRALAMMGDVGSNALGAALGLALVLAAPTWAVAAALVVLVALHILAERVSITGLIEASPILRALDRLTGIR